MTKKLKLSYHQGLGPIFEKGRTFGDIIEAAAKETPDKTYIYFEDIRITYRELHRLTNRIALKLLQLGFKKGDILGICLPDWPEYSLMYYACAKIGVITSPISPRYREKEFSMILGHTEAKAVVISSNWQGFNYADMIIGLQKTKLKALEKVFVVGEYSDEKVEDGLYPYENLLMKTQNDQDIENLLKEHLNNHPVDADDLLEIAYTSGTTGAPKGVMQSHNNRIAAGILNNEAWESREDDVMVMMAPLAHSTGSNHSQNAALLGRYSIVYLGLWEPEKALAVTDKLGGTILIGVPTMFILMMNHENFKIYDMSSVRGIWCAGSSVAVTIAKQITEAFGARFIQTYGTTECGGNHCTRPGDDIETACATGGPSVRGMEAKIIDHKGNIVPIGEPGEICARGVTRFLGYYKNPEATDEAIDKSGWFHSGDLGVMDENGYVKIIGRIKDMVIRGGENIYTSEMEEAIYQHPEVLEVYVIGYPDEKLGERTCAFIVPKTPKIILTRDDMVDFLNGKIAKYKIPDRVEIIEETPLTPSGKVKKFKLQEMLTEKLTEEGSEVNI